MASFYQPNGCSKQNSRNFHYRACEHFTRQARLVQPLTIDEVLHLAVFEFDRVSNHAGFCARPELRRNYCGAGSLARITGGSELPP